MKNIVNESTVTCPVCSGRHWESLMYIRLDMLSVCCNCKLIATSSFLLGNCSIDTLYDVNEKDRQDYEKFYLPKRLASFRKVLLKLEKYRNGSRILELGSGYGDFLLLADKSGWQAEGLEISKYASNIAHQKGCRVYDVGIENIDTSPCTYDAIVMWDVIEHLMDPLPIISTCTKLLRSGGVLMIKTPDGRALKQSRGILWWAYQQFVYPSNTAEHIFHYTPNKLREILTGHQLSNIEIDDVDNFDEKVISGRNVIIRLIRLILMRYAHFRRWPYEFIITAVKS